MYRALAQWEVTPALVTLATLVTLEIESTVQVRHYGEVYLALLCAIFFMHKLRNMDVLKLKLR